MNYSVYKALTEKLEQHYQKLHREIEETFGQQLTPLLIQYDTDIDILTEKLLKGEISEETFEQLQKEQCDQLFDDSTPFVDEHDKMLKLLNNKMQSAQRLIQERYIEENKHE